MTDHFFDSAGNWVAFRKGKFFFLPSGAWLGWLGSDSDVFDVDGAYLGTIVSDRIFRSDLPAQPVNESHPGYPGRQLPADHPGYPGRFQIPLGMEDVGIVEHA